VDGQVWAGVVVATRDWPYLQPWAALGSALHNLVTLATRRMLCQLSHRHHYQQVILTCGHTTQAWVGALRYARVSSLELQISVHTM